jgi:Ca2+-binding RTX toxin-like protein
VGRTKGKGWLIAVPAALLLLLGFALPAAASASATISVENGAIRYVGDDGPNRIDVFAVENGEQAIDATGVTIGSGCRERPPGEPGGFGNVLCSRAGVDRFEFAGGAGDDTFSTGGTTVLDIPVHADMGDGNDRFEFGSTQSDVVTLGDGGDFVLDGIGDDHYDLGAGNDLVSSADFSVGNDTILGGEGDDNIDGNAGDDTIDGGPGNDLFQPSEGNDALNGGPGDDSVGCDDPGNDTVSGGPGNDRICGGPGMDTIDGGDGDDSVSSLDGQVDGPVNCGAGADAVWSDAFDPVSLDCEQQGQPVTITLPQPDVLPVALPCAAGACAGKVTVFATPGAAQPQIGGPPPHESPKPSGKALVRSKFSLRGKARRTVRLKLGRAAAKRLKKLGATTVEARTAFTQAGKRYSIRRTFRVKPR